MSIFSNASQNDKAASENLYVKVKFTREEVETGRINAENVKTNNK